MREGEPLRKRSKSNFGRINLISLPHPAHHSTSPSFFFLAWYPPHTHCPAHQIKLTASFCLAWYRSVPQVIIVQSTALGAFPFPYPWHSESLPQLPPSFSSHFTIHISHQSSLSSFCLIWECCLR